MTAKNFVIRKAAVLGAGVMGAQIAAHLANAKVPVVLFDLPAKEGPKNGIVQKAIDALKKQKPAPLAGKEAIAYISAANYDDDLAKLADCDLVIEAVAERLDIKESLYTKVAPHLGEHTIFATNTSGLSVETLSGKFPADLKHRFCGVHFFNPPRYMHLVELIPTAATAPEYLDNLERFLVSTLGKGVVRAKDTPNFIGNRIGVFSMLATIYNTEKFGLRFDVVDDLTGKRLGRAKSATFRTADVVGLDTFAHVAKTMEDNLPQDPWHAHFTLPQWLHTLIENGALGSKTKAGIFKKEGKRIMMFDPAAGEYVASNKKADSEVTDILKEKDWGKKLAALRASDNPQAQFLWAILRDSFHYIAVHGHSIATTARDVDFAIRWGFGWEQGPLEIWQAAGVQQVAGWIQEDIDAGEAMSNAPLPEWLKGVEAFHNNEGSFNFSTGAYDARSSLDVYQRQFRPAALLGENLPPLGKTVFETEVMRGFTFDDEILVIENLNKMRAISRAVLESINQAIAIAEKDFKALVFWAPEAPFSVGADLKSMMPEFATGDFEAIESMVKLFQDTSMNLRYSQIPTVSAVQGFAFGGGCEFVMHSNKVVAALESYVGLVEVGVGLIPAGGGTKDFALQAARASQGDLLAALKDRYMNLAMAKVATSAIEAKEMGFMRESDVVVFNSYELLHVALAEAKTLADSGFRPDMPATFPVAGRSGAASIKGQLLNMKEGGFISEYDMHIGSQIAWVITGGDVDPGTLVDEQWVLDLERQVFVDLLKNEKTLERIENMMSTGKPLRN
ncbi:3-hydroxyacyl-CoA dehydrogenase/enoyl-CoA hydratase family protein [Uruburuella testudinis]|uniref:3-hydroxyacyl-CoA dehydrogenase/enoyl-CoA hydratase family protein n=1 Tax=Uruburuella testudinis TaxID=1282863 RepID=A0ABY4DSW7_9NEIS|nr:3-hydroxyacyl-CoA dehydrogenase/enoyl-CoA hydratase family protein [Uruburuella testudinis]UOO82141.1 3-hydroxyacyl-CoA dehydrogenase/enoyl-CoA hydratase family protein [Uruburuella testudinis]